MDRIVKETIQAYKTWHFPGVICGCGNGAPICPKCEWEKQVLPRLQAMINRAAVTLPLPRMEINEPRQLPEVPSGHPLDIEPTVKILNIKSHQARYAAALVKKLAEEGHAVFYITQTTAISTAYSREVGQGDQAVRDAMINAPVLVFHHNRDGRKNGWIADLVYSRQNGICFVIEEVGGGF